MTTPEKPRWLYRLENYGRAFSLLREAMEIMDSRPLTQLEKEGVIQRFEFTWELAWKLLKDYLEASGVALETITPAAVIRAGFAAKIIQEGDIWMQALDARNKMSHTYNFKIFEKIIEDIRARYFARLEELYTVMIERAVTEGGQYD